MVKFYVIVYLASIVIANLLVAQFGPQITIVNAFLFIGLDLTVRDTLHEAWQKNLWRNMFLLILSGSVLSAALNINAMQIAAASFLAFLAASVVDALVYQRLLNRHPLVKMNGSNLFSAATDSLVFPIVAFGFPPLWGIVLGQFIAKVAGGLFWSLVITWAKDRGE